MSQLHDLVALPLLSLLHRAPSPPIPPSPPPSSPPPLSPPPPVSPPPHPVKSFAVHGHVIENDAFWDGWSNEGDYPWLRAIETLHGKSNRMTGPRRGPGENNEGAYWYAGSRSSSAFNMVRQAGVKFNLAYAGDLCGSYGTIGWVNFTWHMFRHPAANRNYKIGTLRVYTGRHELWSRSGDYGDVWHRNERVRVNAASFAFEYVMADGFSEPALSEIVLECDFAPPPLPPRAPPSYPKPLPPPNPNLPPAPPLPAAKQVPLDGLWIALVLACGFAWIVTHKKLIFGIGTPRTENAKLSFLQL